MPMGGFGQIGQSSTDLRSISMRDTSTQPEKKQARYERSLPTFLTSDLQAIQEIGEIHFIRDHPTVDIFKSLGSLLFTGSFNMHEEIHIVNVIDPSQTNIVMFPGESHAYDPISLDKNCECIRSVQNRELLIAPNGEKYVREIDNTGQERYMETGF